MPNVAELIKDHVTLDVKCMDRLYLNGYVPRLQCEGGVVAFLRRAGGRVVPSPAIFGEITNSFRARLRAWCEQREIPWIEFRKGDRKDDLVQQYRERFTASAGVVLVGVAQERASAWSARKGQRGAWVHFTWQRKSVCVNHYYIYVIDREWGPAFLKVCGYAPYALKLCLNGHEWAKRQLQRRRMRFTEVERMWYGRHWGCSFRSVVSPGARSTRPGSVYFRRSDYLPSTPFGGAGSVLHLTVPGSLGAGPPTA